MCNKFDALQEKIGIRFLDEDLLKLAFTHSSFFNEKSTRSLKRLHNERLEFLGDAVLELAVSNYLYNKFPEMTEGELTKMRAAIVCETSLFEIAISAEFDKFVLLGKGEESGGGRTRPALLADVFEAYIGALFLDCGLKKVNDFLEKMIFAKIAEGHYAQINDYKTELQEKVQKTGLGKLKYEVVDEKGPAHGRIFTIKVFINEKEIGRGQGKTKKEAAQNAAAKALNKLHN